MIELDVGGTMALYQYDLYLVRTDRPEGLLDALRRNGVVEARDSWNGVVLPGGARALVDEDRVTTPGGVALQLTTLFIVDEDVRLWTRDFDLLHSWLQDTARTVDLLVAFMPGGPDASAGVPGVEAFLSALVDDGRLVSAHALMWFASTVADGSICNVDSPAYRVFRAPGLGCLFALLDLAEDGSFNILEPGPLQSALLHPWARRRPASRDLT